MQAIAETLFDIGYLISVITIGGMMIGKSNGKKEYRLFGIMAVILGVGDSFHLVPRIYALCTTGLENYTALLGAGKFVTSITMTIFYVLFYQVWRMRERGAYHSGVFPGSSSNFSLPDASKSVDQPICSAFLGYLPEHSLCSSGPLHPSPVL